MSIEAVILPYVIPAMALALCLVLVTSRRTASNANGHTKTIVDAAAQLTDSSMDLLQYYERRIALLERQLDLEGRAPINPAQVDTVYETARLLNTSFSNDELITLALELGIDDVPGDSRQAKATALTLTAKNRGQLWHLVEIARKQRPTLSWPNAK